MSDPLEDSSLTGEPLGVIKATVSEEFGQKIADQYARNIERYAPMESYTLTVNGHEKIFKRRKILGGERTKLEVLRYKYRSQVRKGSIEAPVTESQIYKKAANYQLIDPETGQGMTEEQYDLIPFEDTRVILDAITFRTEKPIPPLETT